MPEIEKDATIRILADETKKAEPTGSAFFTVKR
jgi:hypothetical protein